MTDYHPLVARAVDGLERSTDEARRALYERAQGALVTQLRSFNPPLSESEITKERLALEDAIRKVEADAARKTTRGKESTLDVLEELTRLAGNPSSEAFGDAAEREEARRREEKLRREFEEKAKRREDELRRQFEEDARRREEELRRQLDQEAQAREQEFRRRHEEQWLRPRKLRARLAEVASPAPSLTPDGRLDAGPNVPYDVPISGNDLPTLPLRQRAVIKSILSGLPGNAPRQLRTSLESYDDELKVRGAQSILGLLKEMSAIVAADVGATNAMREWLDEGLQEAFKLFAENHNLFVKHFPLDPEREELYNSTNVDENTATGSALSGPFATVANATLNANKAGLTTDDFLRIVDKLAEFARVTSTLPSSPPSEVSKDQKARYENTIPLAVGPEDRIVAEASLVTAKKRALLSGFGFFERAYNLLGSTATLAGTEEGSALLSALRESLFALSKLIGFN